MFKCTEHETHLDVRFVNLSSANALGLGAARDLDRVRRRYARWRRPVVFRSAHPTVFCAGGNLTDHARLTTKAAGLRSNLEIKRILDAFGRWPTPKLAVVEGRALGGGVEWLARFDVRWATPTAELAFWQKRVGLSFGWGGGAPWAKVIGEGRVRQLLIEARRLDAVEAHRLGLIDRVVQASDLTEDISAWARAISSPIDEALCGWTARTEAAVFAKLWWGKAHRAALAAWASKS